MVRGFFGSIGALALLALLSVGSARAQEVLTGTVQQVDERSGVILFDDGRQVQTTGRTIVLVERPVDRVHHDRHLLHKLLTRRAHRIF